MSVAAILLAAGRSRRMGAFKPLLDFGGRTVVEACIANLIEGGAEKIVVVVGHKQDEMRASLAHLSIQFAVNDDAESEMNVSIARGVDELPPGTGAILMALVDYPAVPAEVPRALIERWRESGALIVVPEHAGRGGHPVLLDGSLRAELANLDPQRGLRALIEMHRSDALRVPVQSPYIARDMDTWDDYRALYEEVFHKAPPRPR